MSDIKELKQLQITQVNILKEVDVLCRKYKIQYFLIGGTLLGAKRHEGFIPWDDDLDIAMLREDYNKFEEIASKELKNGLYFKNIHTDSNYYLPFEKVCKKDTLYVTSFDENTNLNNEIFIDVFPLDYVKKEKSLKQKIQSSLIKGIKAVVIRRKNLKVKSTSKKIKFLMFIFKPFSDLKLMSIQERLMISNKKTKYIVNNGSNYSYLKQTMSYNIYFPAKEMKFEGNNFFVPQNTEYWLNRIYGPDYMELPPEEKRLTHNIVKLKI